MGIRSVRRGAHSQQWRDDGNSVMSRTDGLVGPGREIAEQLIKQVVKLNSNALSIDTRYFYYYKRRASGRTCSCLLGEQTSPDGMCNVCYGTGVVGGYDKYGTWSETLDYTTPELTTSGIVPELGLRPVLLVLDPMSTSGWIESTFQVRRNQGYVDTIRAIYSSKSGYSKVTPTIRAAGSPLSSAVPLNDDNLTAMLRSAMAITLRVVMTRESVDVVSPAFSSIYFRYGLLKKPNLSIPGDIPTNTETVNLQEYGFEEQFGVTQIVFDNRITSYTQDDFLYYPEQDKVYKITEVSPKYAIGKYMGFDVNCRVAQQFEIYRKFPY